MMEEMYGLHHSSPSTDQYQMILARPEPYSHRFVSPPAADDDDYNSGGFVTVPTECRPERNSVLAVDTSEPQAVSDEASMVQSRWRGERRSSEEDEISGAIRARIASHPLYPRLLRAYIDCQKVGAPPEVAVLLEDIQSDNDLCTRTAVSPSSCLGSDPELDEFMEAYCEVLVKYKSDLSRPFDEATTFLNNIETQLNNLCASSRTHISAEAAGSSVEEFSGGEIEVQDFSHIGEHGELKDKLLRKYSGYISSLKLEFSKKKKKGKLPKEARQTLLDWWNVHYKWPYPTEGDKVALAEVTGLDQKQINNWFINQRKRHWKPSENMQFDTVYVPYFSSN